MFSPKYWHDGGSFRVALVVSERRTRATLLLVEGDHLRTQDVPKDEITTMRDVDYGAREAKKMRASLRRLGRHKATTKAARRALKEVLA